MNCECHGTDAALMSAQPHTGSLAKLSSCVTLASVETIRTLSNMVTIRQHPIVKIHATVT